MLYAVHCNFIITTIIIMVTLPAHVLDVCGPILPGRLVLILAHLEWENLTSKNVNGDDNKGITELRTCIELM